MYFQNTINEKIYIKSEDLKKYNKDNINSHVKSVITNKFGDKCQKYGLLLKDSIIVFITCFLSFYIIEQIEDLPIIGKNNSTIKKTIPVFTDNPEF